MHVWINISIDQVPGSMRRGGKRGRARQTNEGEEATLTTRRLKFPSSTTCVATIPFANSAQKVAATIPACTAVRTVNATDSCSKIEPVVNSWSGRASQLYSACWVGIIASVSVLRANALGKKGRLSVQRGRRGLKGR
jgi:hypothetical protein